MINVIYVHQYSYNVRLVYVHNHMTLYYALLLFGYWCIYIRMHVNCLLCYLGPVVASDLGMLEGSFSRSNPGAAGQGR